MILRKLGKLIAKKLPAGALLGAMLLAMTITGCTSSAGSEDGRDPGVPTATQVVAEREGGDSRGEHGGSGQGSEPEAEDGELEAGGAGSEGSQGDDEHGPGEEGGQESREAEMSSPIIPLGQSWTGVLGGLAVSMQYDAETRTVCGTVQNTLPQKLCYVQAEPHIKSGTRTVGELGPEKLGHLNPGQEVTSSLAVASEPKLAGVSYDGYVVHMEVFDCSGPGPSAHSGEGAEGNGEQGRGGEGGSESGGADEKEGSGGNALAPDEILDMTINGARLVLGYDAASNYFEGTVENTTGGVLKRVRVEVHLSNGTELGPTTPTDVAQGEVLAISLPAKEESFTGWTAHAEVGGGGEPGGEHGSGGESGGEHGSGENTSGEHGTGEESGGEHGSTREPDGEHGRDENHRDRD